MKRIGLMLAGIAFFLFVQAAQAQWTPIKRITWNSGASWCPAISVDPSGKLHVAWYDDTPTPGIEEIYYKKSTDGGATWMTNQRLTWSSGTSQYPAIAVDSSGNVHVVWDETVLGYHEIYYIRSTDGGTTWSASRRFTWNSGLSQWPAVAVDSSGGVHVVWSDSAPGYAEIYYKRSTDGGATWMTNQRLTWNSGWSEWPAIAVDSSDTLHVVWNDNTPGNSEIYYKKSTDGGSNWSTNKRLTWNGGDSFKPAVAVDSSGNPHLVWIDEPPGDYEIYYKKSTEGGATWMASKRLTWNGDGWGYGYPAVAVDSSGNPHLVWDNDAPGDIEIYYRKSTNGGTSWMASKRLTWNTGYSVHPTIGVDSSDNIHVVWCDTMFGNREICYRKYVKE